MAGIIGIVRCCQVQQNQELPELLREPTTHKYLSCHYHSVTFNLHCIRCPIFWPFTQLSSINMVDVFNLDSKHLT